MIDPNTCTYRMSVVAHPELQDHDIPALTWNYHNVPMPMRGALRSARAIVFRVDGLHRRDRELNERLWDDAGDALFDVVWEVIDEWFPHAYVLHVDDPSQLRSRIRSYKGPFYDVPSIANELMYKREIDVGEQKSSFVSVIRMTDDNRRKLYGRAHFTADNSVFILSRAERDEEMTCRAVSFVDRKVHLTDPLMLNEYAVPFFLEPGVAVPTWGAASTNTSLAFGIYFHDQDREALPRSVRRLVPETAWTWF